MRARDSADARENARDRAVGRARLEHMRRVDAPRDPFLHEKAPQISPVLATVDRRRLQGHQFAGDAVRRQIDVAAVARVQGANNRVAIDDRARIEDGRHGQGLGDPGELIGLAVGNFVDARDLRGQVVVAAVRQRRVEQQARRAVEIAGVRLDDPGRDGG